MNLFKNNTLPLLFAALTLAACSSSNEDNSNQSGSDNTNKNVASSVMASEVTRLEFPHVSSASNDTIVVHYALNQEVIKKMSTTHWPGTK
jgi:uncharacterized protein YcfL